MKPDTIYKAIGSLIAALVVVMVCCALVWLLLTVGKAMLGAM